MGRTKRLHQRCNSLGEDRQQLSLARTIVWESINIFLEYLFFLLVFERPKMDLLDIFLTRFLPVFIFYTGYLMGCRWLLKIQSRQLLHIENRWPVSISNTRYLCRFLNCVLDANKWFVFVFCEQLWPVSLWQFDCFMTLLMFNGCSYLPTLSFMTAVWYELLVCWIIGYLHMLKKSLQLSLIRTAVLPYI